MFIAFPYVRIYCGQTPVVTHSSFWPQKYINNTIFVNTLSRTVIQTRLLPRIIAILTVVRPVRNIGGMCFLQLYSVWQLDLSLVSSGQGHRPYQPFRELCLLLCSFLVWDYLSVAFTIFPKADGGFLSRLYLWSEQSFCLYGSASLLIREAMNMVPSLIWRIELFTEIKYTLVSA